MTTTEELITLKTKIERVEREKARIEGELAAADRRLREEFGCASFAEAQEKLGKEQERLADLDAEIENGIAKLREEYGL